MGNPFLWIPYSFWIYLLFKSSIFLSLFACQRSCKTDVKFVPGVGPKRGRECWTRRSMCLLWAICCGGYPYRYIDRSRVYYIHEIDGSMPYIQLKGRITAIRNILAKGVRDGWLPILPTERGSSIWCGFKEFDTSRTGIKPIPNILFLVDQRSLTIAGTLHIPRSIRIWVKRIVPTGWWPCIAPPKKWSRAILIRVLMQKINRKCIRHDPRKIARVAFARCGTGCTRGYLFMMPSKTFIFRRIRYCCAMRSIDWSLKNCFYIQLKHRQVCGRPKIQIKRLCL